MIHLVFSCGGKLLTLLNTSKHFYEHSVHMLVQTSGGEFTWLGLSRMGMYL